MKIGIVNAWGNNRGDEAMLSALLCYLNALNFKVNTTIYSHQWLDLDRHKASRYLRIFLSIVFIHRSKSKLVKTFEKCFF